MAVIESLKKKARELQTQVITLYFAVRDCRTPFYVKAFGYSLLAYALSPIDLIPDFIPILGILDDLILLPAGLAILLRLIPNPILQAARLRADEAGDTRWLQTIGLMLTIAIWIALAAIALRVLI